MKVGASYYPEIIPPSEWERDLATGREIGLSCLRCGEFAWTAFMPEPGAWTPDWAVEFLELAAEYGYDVIWGTPSAAPPPYLFQKWPDLQMVNQEGLPVPVGVRRNYCPSHEGYMQLCEEVAERLAETLASVEVIKGWQVDNELAGDGFGCWCPLCQKRFQQWLKDKYGDLRQLNSAWQTSIWSQVYSTWEEIPIPVTAFTSHAPSLRLVFRRFRSENWQQFYRRQAEALHRGGAKVITTNFFNLEWDVPFDHWQWRPDLEVMSIGSYTEDEISTRFQLALLQGPEPGEKPLWVLEQKAGQQVAQNLYPEDLGRLERHLRICREAGVEYAVYWHLRQHSAGCEQEHGAVLRHDGKPTRIAYAIGDAIAKAGSIPAVVSAEDKLLLFSFQQQWAQENRRQPGTAWTYWEEVAQSWYAGAKDAWGGVRIGDVSTRQKKAHLVLAPFLQMAEPGLLETLDFYLKNGATVITTADLGRLDFENNVLRKPPLDCLRLWGVDVPELEMLHLRQDAEVAGELEGEKVTGRIFWAVPLDSLSKGIRTVGETEEGEPLALVFPVKKGTLIVVMTALSRGGVKALLDWVVRDK